MEAAKEAGMVLIKPIITMMGGFLTINFAQIEYINELIGDDFYLTKNIISKTNREKDQEYEEKKIDIERKAWDLANDQKKANEEGLIEIIKELQETIKDSKK